MRPKTAPTSCFQTQIGLRPMAGGAPYPSLAAKVMALRDNTPARG